MLGRRVAAQAREHGLEQALALVREADFLVVGLDQPDIRQLRHGAVARLMAGAVPAHDAQHVLPARQLVIGRKRENRQRLVAQVPRLSHVPSPSALVGARCFNARITHPFERGFRRLTARGSEEPQSAPYVAQEAVFGRPFQDKEGGTSMANDRYRYEQDRTRDRDRDERDWRGRDRQDEGYIARRGFGNERSGYGRGGYGGDDERFGERRRERDFGDSAGYGTGGSALDWHDVMGGERRGAGMGFGAQDRGREESYPRQRRGSFYDREDERYGSGFFGRGSREDDGDERGFLDRAGDEVRSWFGDEGAERRRGRDMREAAHHRGRGPKGYQRSDARILEDVNDRLTDDPHVDASNIDVSVANREVTLNGTVNSRFEKRHAEDLAESVSGVIHVQNNLRVQQPAEAGIGGSMMSGSGTGAEATPRRRSSTPSGT